MLASSVGFFTAFIRSEGFSRSMTVTPGCREEIALQLSHRDVVLDFFKGKKGYIFGLRAGEPLCFTPGDRELHARVNGKAMPVVRYSKAFRERLKRLTDRRYRPYSSKIRFILAWKGKEDAEEAEELLKLFDLAKKDGKGAFSYKGKMVDSPVAERARGLLERYKAIGNL